MQARPERQNQAMTTPLTISTAREFWVAASCLQQFSPVRYSSGPSKSHLYGSSVVFLDGLMTRASKKADVAAVTQGLNAAALFGWATFSNATKINQFLTMIFKRITGESDAVCQLAASLSALAFEWPEFSDITEHPEVVHAIASLNFSLYSQFYKQLEAARML